MTRFIDENRVLTLSPAKRAGGLLLISGQVGHVDYELVDGGVEAQLRQAMANVQSIVQEHGGTLADIVKVTLYFADIDDFWRATEVYREYFEVGRFPARTALQAAALPFGAAIEVEAIAYLPRTKVEGNG